MPPTDPAKPFCPFFFVWLFWPEWKKGLGSPPRRPPPGPLRPGAPLFFPALASAISFETRFERLGSFCPPPRGLGADPPTVSRQTQKENPCLGRLFSSERAHKKTVAPSPRGPFVEMAWAPAGCPSPPPPRAGPPAGWGVKKTTPTAPGFCLFFFCISRVGKRFFLPTVCPPPRRNRYGAKALRPLHCGPEPFPKTRGSARPWPGTITLSPSSNDLRLEISCRGGGGPPPPPPHPPNWPVPVKNNHHQRGKSPPFGPRHAFFGGVPRTPGPPPVPPFLDHQRGRPEVNFLPGFRISDAPSLKRRGQIDTMCQRPAVNTKKSKPARPNVP